LGDILGLLTTKTNRDDPLPGPDGEVSYRPAVLGGVAVQPSHGPMPLK
jgi:hypothetical protein